MRKFLNLICVAILLSFSLHIARAQTSRGTVVGELVLTPDPKDSNGIIMILKEDFGYIDAAGTEWLAKAGDRTDGASIPMPAWSFVGGPWEGRYREAAVLHDHYCQAHVRVWQSTHLMFYEAMLANGVSKAKANLMYYAVYAFGPRWGILKPGVPCGKNCVFVVQTRFASRKMEDNNKLIADELADIDAAMTKNEANGVVLTTDDLESIANSKRPNDPFFIGTDPVK